MGKGLLKGHDFDKMYMAIATLQCSFSKEVEILAASNNNIVDYDTATTKFFDALNIVAEQVRDIMGDAMDMEANRKLMP